MTKCPTPIGYFIGPNGDRIDAPCNRWQCPVCSKVLKNKLMDRVRDHFIGHNARFLTLTLQKDYKGDIMKAWAKFRALLLKRGIKLVYFLVKEFHENGQRHLHVMIDHYLNFKLIQKLWLLATKGTSFIIFIKQIDAIRVPAAYMTKYFMKSFTDHSYGQHERRYSFSRGAIHKKYKPNNKYYFIYYPHDKEWDIRVKEISKIIRDAKVINSIDKK